MPDPRFRPALDRAFRWVDQAVSAEFGQPEAFTAMLREQVAALWARAAEDQPIFAPVALPVALSGPNDAQLAAACTAFHLACAVMTRDGSGFPMPWDGAAPSDAPSSAEPGAPSGVPGGDGPGRGASPDAGAGCLARGTAGGRRFQAEANQAFLAISLAFLGDLDEAAAALRTAAFATRRLAAGRAMVLDCWSGWPPVDPADALALARLETGCAYACYSQLAAIGGGLPGEAWTPLWTWGETIGAAVQVARHARRIESQDPERATRMAFMAENLRDEAAAILANLWLPWGARPLLEAVAARPSSVSAGSR